MSQGTSGWPDWITATTGVLSVAVAPAIAWVAKKISGAVSRKELKTYLEKRDELSERRHNENLGRLDHLAKEIATAREKVAHLEGAISGSYRRPT